MERLPGAEQRQNGMKKSPISFAGSKMVKLWGGFLLRDFGILLFPPPVSMTGVSPHLLFVLASAFTKAMVQNIKLERNCNWPQSESQSQSSALHPCRL
jgi:hypothetical protein